MQKSKQYILLLALLLISPIVAAQGSGSSPYSQYGYGLLDDNSFGASRSMGGVGYALKNSKQINAMNPASYAAMDSLTFLLDIGASIQNTFLTEDGTTQSNVNASLEYLAIQFPLGKHMAASVGLVPYSTVGYSYSQSVPYSTGEEDAGTAYSAGSGSINQAYIGVGANLFKGFSVGANISYLFGSLAYNNSVFPSSTSEYSVYYESMTVRDFHIQFGAQYSVNLSREESLTLGVVYTPKKSLLGDYITAEYGYDSSSSLSNSVADTTSLGDSYELPMSLGAGVSYVKNNNLTLAADVTYQQWSDVNYAGETGNFSDRLKIAAGAEYIPSSRSRNYLKRMNYRAGAFYTKSYINMYDSPLNEIGASCGLGFPVNGDKSIINLSLEYVNRQPAATTSQINEQFVRLSVGLTFNELWFFQRRLE